MSAQATNMRVEEPYGNVGGAILIKSKALDDRLNPEFNHWSPETSCEQSTETSSGEGSSNSSHRSTISTPSPVSDGSERLSPLVGVSRRDATPVAMKSEPVIGEGVMPSILRGPRPEGVEDLDISVYICSVATELFRDTYRNVDPPQFLNALVEASTTSGDCFTPVNFNSVESNPIQEQSVRAGLAHCVSAAKFLRNYGLSAALPPQPESEIKNKTFYIGIPCFTETPEEILPTIESILRNGGDEAPRVHIILCCDVRLNNQTRQRVDTVPFGVTWSRNDGAFSFTFINKGLSTFTGKTSSLYLISKYVCARMAKDQATVVIANNLTPISEDGVETPQERKPARNFLVLADTRIIYGKDSTKLMFDHMETHLDVIACTSTQELYPVRFANSTGIVDGTPTRALEARRPTYWEWIGAPAMQQFEFEANYAVGQFAYHHGGRLAILPGPCHFLDMDKVADSSVFESFNRDILRYGSELITDHWLKLYVMAEDRHLSTLYATKTKWKTSWVSGAYFFYKPEKTWTDMLQQRIRWQGGTLAQHYVVVFRPAVIFLGHQDWAWWYTSLSALSFLQFAMCCMGNAVWVFVCEFGRDYSPLPYRDEIINGVIWANLIFPWMWVSWSSLVNKGYIKYTDLTSSFMVGVSLTLSAVSVIVCACSLLNPVNPKCEYLEDDDAKCINFSWLKATAIAVACLPMIAWSLMGPSVGVRMTWNLCSTMLLSFFTPILFASHQYNSTPLHVCARLQDLTWRGNKIMRSEYTVGSEWVKWIAWVIVFFETAIVLLSDASPIEFTQFFRINLIAFTVILLFPLFLPFGIGFWLVIENFLRYMMFK